MTTEKTLKNKEQLHPTLNIWHYKKNDLKQNSEWHNNRSIYK